MDKDQQAKLSMLRSVETYAARPEVLSTTLTIPAIKLATDELTAIIELIEQLDEEAASAARGDGGNKDGLRKLATATAFIVDGKITAWAARRKVPEVINAFNHERSDFTRLSGEDFRTLVARVITKAKELNTPPPQAAEENLTTAHITTLEARLAAFVTSITRPEDLQKHEAAVGQLVDAQFAAADTLLDLRLDKLMRELSELAPALYADYQQARVIYDAATRHEKKEEGTGGTAP
jgi:hypothetical protein